MRWDNPWSEEDHTALVRMWVDEKRSAGFIGKALNRSRCSVIGRLWRKEISRPPLERKPTRVRPQKSFFKINGQYLRWAVPPTAETGTVTFRSLLSGQCHYIAREVAGAETLMCGLPTVRAGPWCGYHDQLCHLRKGGAPTNPPGAPSGTVVVAPPGHHAATVPTP